MEGGGIVEEIKKISFGFDEKIKLIDMLSEDDDFLVADHPLQEYSLSGLRLSGFENSEIVQEKEQHCDIVQQTRPSLAWDTAFFNSAGVLEPDELSFINEGFKTSTQDVRNRRSMKTNGDDGFCLDNSLFEIEPFECKSKSTRSGGLGQEQEAGLQTVKALKKIDKSFRNKMKYKQTPNEKISTKLQIEEKLNKKAISRRKQGNISSPNPPKAPLNRTRSVSTRSNSRDLSRKFDVKMENKSATTNLQISPKHNSSQSQATAEILKPSGIRPPSPRIRFFDEMTPPRYQEVPRSRKMPPKVSSQEISATANTQIDYLKSDLLPDSSVRCSRNASAYKKLKSPCSESAYNIKRTRTDHTTHTSFPLPDKRCSGKKLGPSNSSLDGETVDLKKKKFRESQIGVVNRVKRAAHQENVFESEVCDLNKYFEGIELNQERKKHIINRESVLQDSPMRTPLADKNMYVPT